MRIVINDGGRAACGYQGTTGDCVTRAVAIAAHLHYQDVYDAINLEAQRERRPKKSGARTGVYIPTVKRYLTKLGWKWTSTMFIGSGCTVHLREDELPMGRLIVSVSRHLVAVIDRVIHDTGDPTRGGTRCVYGYWTYPTIVK